MSSLTICLVGNPNCGKTTLFNALTGARQQVGNWPGVTVERKTGSYRSAGGDVSVIDLPGVYSLAVTSVSSLDERIARNFVLSGEADLVVNILDASNLERNLYLTTQLLEMRVPMIVALNMLDVARERRTTIDAEALARRLGCPVIPMVASRGEGVDKLRDEIGRAAKQRRVPSVEVGYGPEVENAITQLLPTLADPQINIPRLPSQRWLAIKLLEGDEAARTMVPPAVLAEAERVAEATYVAASEDCDILIADSRYGLANALIRDTVTREGVVRKTLSDRIDRVVLHRLLGIPIFFAVMYLLFLFTINFGGAFIDFFDQFFGTLLVDGGGALLASLGSPLWLTTILANGIGGGIQTISTFIPIIACLFLFLSFLEDFGLHGAGRLRHGPADAGRRPARQVVHPADRRIRLQRAGDHGDANPGSPARPDHDGDDGAVHVVRGPPARLRPVCRRLLPGGRAEPGLCPLPDRHRLRRPDRAGAEAHPAAG